MVIKLLRRATGNWTIERKSILFFGTTLLVSICASFWIVHRVSNHLVMQATVQTARDYAQIWRNVRAADTLRDRLGYLFGPPGWEPAGHRPDPDLVPIRPQVSSGTNR